jgi:hypothetical protein
MIFKSQLMTSASGSVGGLTFTHNRYSPLVCRSRVVPCDPNTCIQNNARRVFNNGGTHWRTLTQEQQASWNDYANGTPWLGPLGDTIYLTGQAFYIATMGVVMQHTPNKVLTAFDTAPPIPGLAPQPYVAFQVCAAGTGMGMKIYNQDPVYAMQFTAHVSAAQSPGKTFFKGPWDCTRTVHTATVLHGAFVVAEFCDLNATAQYWISVRGFYTDTPHRISKPYFCKFIAEEQALLATKSFKPKAA